jgi:hypothetical protein
LFANRLPLASVAVNPVFTFRPIANPMTTSSPNYFQGAIGGLLAGVFIVRLGAVVCCKKIRDV